MSLPVGSLVQAFLADEFPVQRGLRPASVKAYRDGLRLLLLFVAGYLSCRLTQVSCDAFTLDRVLRFLQDLETSRQSSADAQSPADDPAGLSRFSRAPLARASRRGAASGRHRRQANAAPGDVLPAVRGCRDALATAAHRGPHALRDRALFLVLYNTGARVREIADLRIEHLDLSAQPRVRLHGKGDKRRLCPLWPQTVDALTRLLYKIVRRHTDPLRVQGAAPIARPIGPHIFRHTAAVHLLEAGVDVSVIRGWPGHVSLETTNRYAEITTRMKEAALRGERPAEEVAGHRD